VEARGKDSWTALWEWAAREEQARVYKYGRAVLLFPYRLDQDTSPPYHLITCSDAPRPILHHAAQHPPLGCCLQRNCCRVQSVIHTVRINGHVGLWQLQCQIHSVRLLHFPRVLGRRIAERIWCRPWGRSRAGMRHMLEVDCANRQQWT
jgi:hypothetical protein